jgi:hypothetical protein
MKIQGELNNLRKAKKYNLLLVLKIGGFGEITKKSVQILLVV